MLLSSNNFFSTWTTLGVAQAIVVDCGFVVDHELSIVLVKLQTLTIIAIAFGHSSIHEKVQYGPHYHELRDDIFDFETSVAQVTSFRNFITFDET